jgi:hypothetical protein
MDPWCRTIEGFRQLIHKEWCDTGHMFALRCGHSRRHPNQCAPIFGQFIDAVAQLMIEQREAFEFTEDFLAFLLFHSYAQLYGDFSMNCYRERTTKARPPSLWMCIADPAADERFRNTGFRELDGDLNTTIKQYTISGVICAIPLFGCRAGLFVKPDPPEMRQEWMTTEPMAILAEFKDGDHFLDEAEAVEDEGDTGDSDPDL